MRFLFLSFFIFASLLCSAQIKVSAQKNVQFSNYKTFAVQKGQVVSMLKDQKINENKVFRVLQESITREMTMRGFTLADDSTAQLIVSYFLEEADRSTYQKPGPLGQTPIEEPANINEANRSDVSRTLIVEIENNKNKDSLWTATYTFGRSSRDVYGLLDEATTQIFQKFMKLKIRR